MHLLPILVTCNFIRSIGNLLSARVMVIQFDSSADMGVQSRERTPPSLHYSRAKTLFFTGSSGLRSDIVCHVFENCVEISLREDRWLQRKNDSSGKPMEAGVHHTSNRKQPAELCKNAVLISTQCDITSPVELVPVQYMAYLANAATFNCSRDLRSKSGWLTAKTKTSFWRKGPKRASG